MTNSTAQFRVVHWHRALSPAQKGKKMKRLELRPEEAQLLHEAMQRFTRSVGGDLSRDKSPSTENKEKMQRALALGERIQKLVEEK